MNIAVEKYTMDNSVNETDELKAIDKALRDITQELTDEIDESGCAEVNGIEYKLRDGFIPHSFNYGGYNSYSCCGMWTGWNETIENEFDKSRNYIEELGTEEFGKEYDPCRNEDHAQWGSNSLAESNLDTAVIECRTMFHSQDDETGLYSATVSVIARVSDAPYFRCADWYIDFEITFKDASDLMNKIESNDVIEKCVAHLHDSQNESETFEID